MNRDELVVKGKEDLDLETIQVETDMRTVEMPALEARVLLKAFVDDLRDLLKEKAVEKGESRNKLAYVGENASPLLDDSEMKEILKENIADDATAKAYSEISDNLYSFIVQFVDERENGEGLEDDSDVLGVFIDES